jgi:hypothetical protein
MWIDRKTYDDIRLDNAKAQTEARVLAEQNRALQVSLDWFRVRISQLEHERALMIFNYTGVQVPVQTIERTQDQHSVTETLQRVPSFEDLGDKESRRLGVEWDDHGELKYAEK